MKVTIFLENYVHKSFFDALTYYNNSFSNVYSIHNIFIFNVSFCFWCSRNTGETLALLLKTFLFDLAHCWVKIILSVSIACVKDVYIRHICKSNSFTEQHIPRYFVNFTNQLKNQCIKGCIDLIKLKW